MGLPATVYVNETLETEQCCNCGIWFAIPQAVQKRLLENGALFYCPNGHSQHYTKTEIQKLRENLAAEESRHRSTLSRLNEEKAERERVERKLKRVGRGVCPECNRSFQNLAQHMACKHKV